MLPNSVRKERRHGLAATPSQRVAARALRPQEKADNYADNHCGRTKTARQPPVSGYLSCPLIRSLESLRLSGSRATLPLSAREGIELSHQTMYSGIEHPQVRQLIV